MPSAAEQVALWYEREGWSAIRASLDEERSESLHLDFKLKQNAGTPILDSDDRKNLGEALSGFANSEGGVIVWGINARRQGDRDRVVGIEPIAECSYFALALAQATAELVSPPVSGVRHTPILESAQAASGCVVTLIPQSDAAPHMGRARGMQRYYRRIEDSFRPLEHYEVADLFGRRAHPSLTIEPVWAVELSTIDGAGNTKLNLQVRFLLRNRGRAIARFVAITLGKPEGLEPLHWSGRYGASGILQPVPPPSSWWIRLAASSDHVVYPDDEIEAAYVTLTFRNTDVDIPDVRIQYRLIAADVEMQEGEFTLDSATIRASAARSLIHRGLSVAFAY